MFVSTHSRLKAAVLDEAKRYAAGGRVCFNTQPPKGGCKVLTDSLSDVIVSTHSRLKAAGTMGLPYSLSSLFQHTAA